jgi:hypothetical protein
MMFRWDGMYFVKLNEVWVSKNWAMKGPTGSMMDKEVPEPWQSRIEKAYQECLAGGGTIMERRSLGLTEDSVPRITPTKKTSPSTEKTKKRKPGRPRKKDQPVNIDRLKDLMKKESKAPTVARKKKGGVIGGISLTGSKK